MSLYLGIVGPHSDYPYPALVPREHPRMSAHLLGYARLIALSREGRKGQEEYCFPCIQDHKETTPNII